jgi:hypothetical protein
VVVGARAAARAQQRREAGAGGGALDPRVEPGPRRVQLLQPLEQRRLLGQAARRPLVEVVVAVDQAGGGEAAGGVDPAAVRRGRAALADRLDPAVRDDDVAGAVLGAGRVDGGDRAALDDQPLAHARPAASRTASRIFS